MIILFPGLAADEALFAGIHLGTDLVHVANYFPPVDHESLHSYAARMAKTIPAADEYIFIGVSLGGMLAQEVFHFIPAEKIILISSISSSNQKPFYFFIAKNFPLYKMLPERWLKQIILWISEIWTRKNEKEKIMFERMVNHAGLRLIRWGMEQALLWKQEVAPENVIHIHGNKDQVFPIRNIKADHIIEGGEHFMIVQRAQEINELLMKIIRSDAN